MRTSVKKWGNSVAVRIPASVLQAARLQQDQVVEVREEKGRIVIEPVRRKSYDLRKLLAKISKDNLHDSVDFGPPQGNEAW